MTFSEIVHDLAMSPIFLLGLFLAVCFLGSLTLAVHFGLDATPSCA